MGVDAAAGVCRARAATLEGCVCGAPGPGPGPLHTQVFVSGVYQLQTASHLLGAVWNLAPLDL